MRRYLNTERESQITVISAKLGVINSATNLFDNIAAEQFADNTLVFADLYSTNNSVLCSPKLYDHVVDDELTL